MDVQPITVPQSLAYVLDTAGAKSNVDFDYLLKTAMRESSLNPEAKAPSSSAVGLFQFLDSTWLQVMKEEGPRLGYQQYADAISKDSAGDYVVKDKRLRTEILKLRENPQVAADMAAAFTQANGDYLKAKFGRMPSPGELYIAHFLGPQGAEKMFNAGLDNPDQVAAKLFPRQAHANPQIFYDRDGHARTIREVYKALVAKHNDLEAAPLPAPTPAPQPQFVAQQFANGQAPDPADADPSGITPAAMSFSAMFATSATPAAPAPLIGTEAAAPLLAMAATKTSPIADVSSAGPLAAIDAIAGTPSTLGPVAPTLSDQPQPMPSAPKSLVDSPLPAPAPLVAPGSTVTVATAISPPAPTGVPAVAVAVPVAAPAAAGLSTAADTTPAPLALMDPDPTPPQPLASPMAPQVPELPPIPAARIEMTPGVRPNAAFFTQLAFAGQAP